MSTPLFDTLRVTKDLQSSGFDTKQSEGIVAAIEASLESAVATKADVAAVSNEITSARSEIAQLRTELEVKIQTQANKIILAVIAVSAVAAGIIKLL